MNNNLSNKILRAIQKGINEALNFQVIANDEDIEFNGDDQSSYSIDQEIQNAIDRWSCENMSFRKSILNLAKNSNQPQEIIDLCQALYDLSNKNTDLTDYDVEILRKNKLCVVKSKDELKELIEKAIEKFGDNVNLNWINTSEITDMSKLFYQSNFNGDISNWDVSNVTNMHAMFVFSQFNGDISKWDASNVKDMSAMFENSKFNGDISKWNVSNVENMCGMFCDSPFNGDISKWDVRNVKYINGMFSSSIFNKDISQWDVSNVTHISGMFDNCPISKQNKPINYDFYISKQNIKSNSKRN